MRKNKYYVYLESHTAIQWAWNEQEAIILTQAEAIRLEKSYAFVRIHEMNE